MFLFGKKTEAVSKTGFYSVKGKSLIPINELPKTGSYNDIAESLGFPMYHGVLAHDSNKIGYIAFKRRTKEPIFVEARDETQSLSYSDVSKTIQFEIDWGFEWRQLDFEDNL